MTSLITHVYDPISAAQFHACKCVDLRSHDPFYIYRNEYPDRSIYMRTMLTSGS